MGRESTKLDILDKFLYQEVSKGNDINKIKYYINLGANPSYQNKNGESLLHISCAYSNKNNITKTLINAGAKINLQDKLGNTPLHIASYHNNIGAVNALIEAGADLLTTNNDNITPSQINNISNETCHIINETLKKYEPYIEKFKDKNINTNLEDTLKQINKEKLSIASIVNTAKILTYNNINAQTYSRLYLIKKVDIKEIKVDIKEIKVKKSLLDYFRTSKNKNILDFSASNIEHDEKKNLTDQFLKQEIVNKNILDSSASNIDVTAKIIMEYLLGDKAKSSKKDIRPPAPNPFTKKLKKEKKQTEEDKQR